MALLHDNYGFHGRMQGAMIIKYPRFIESMSKALSSNQTGAGKIVKSDCVRRRIIIGPGNGWTDRHIYLFGLKAEIINTDFYLLRQFYWRSVDIGLA